MGKAGRALKQVLEAYGINQTRLAIEMKVPSSNVNRWVNETRDPSGDAIVKSRQPWKSLILRRQKRL
jgi:plasmid maintenance system antidote protein VapI